MRIFARSSHPRSIDGSAVESIVEAVALDGEADEIRTWIGVTASALGAVVLLTGSAIGVALRRWQDDTDHRINQLANPAAAPAARTRRVSYAALDGLPGPVQRYFRTVLSDGQPYVETARIVQVGQFNMSAARADWREYDATQVYWITPPGYVWDARIHLAPLVDVRVRDAYVAQRGAMRGAFLGLITVVDEHDTQQLNEGALQRYLAEAAMFPTALLPDEGVSWRPIDATHAAASMTDGSTSATLEFEFATSGEIVTVSTSSRYRAENGGYVRTPWGGRYQRYETFDGMRVPTEADVYWIRNGLRQSYIRLRVRSARYSFIS